MIAGFIIDNSKLLITSRAKYRSNYEKDVVIWLTRNSLYQLLTDGVSTGPDVVFKLHFFECVRLWRKCLAKAKNDEFHRPARLGKCYRAGHGH
jgi:hypothetical protein